MMNSLLSLLKVSIIDITHVLTIHELLKNLQGPGLINFSRWEEFILSLLIQTLFMLLFKFMERIYQSRGRIEFETI